MIKKQIALIFGSINSEHDISLASAASVLEHFPVDTFDCKLIYISKDGTFNSGDYSIESMQNNTLEGHIPLYLDFDYSNPGFIVQSTKEKIHIDASFLMLHGQMGEGGHVQGLLKCANIPFTGCDVLSSSLCMDKAFTHEVLESMGIPMAQYQLILSLDDVDYSTISYPVIVKPSREGSSFGVSIAHDKDKLIEAINFAFKFDSRVLIEEYIKGVEVGVSVFKTKLTEIISDPDQVNVSGEIFDFQEKYHPHKTETLELAQFPVSINQKVQDYAKEAFAYLDCRHFARIDFFVSETHDIYLNEVNTIPGFTKNSRYPSMIARKGLDFTSQIRLMIEDALS